MLPRRFQLISRFAIHILTRLRQLLQWNVNLIKVLESSGEDPCRWAFSRQPPPFVAANAIVTEPIRNRNLSSVIVFQRRRIVERVFVPNTVTMALQVCFQCSAIEYLNLEEIMSPVSAFEVAPEARNPPSFPVDYMASQPVWEAYY